MTLPPGSFSQSSATDTSTASFDMLALQACDDVDNLREVLRFYIGLEKLIAPLNPGDTEELAPMRSELSSMLRLANSELRRRIDAADGATHQLHEALNAIDREEKTRLDD